MISEFEKIENASLFKPRGAFYGWINVKKPLEKKKMNSEKFIEYLMEKYGVAVLHGSSLGKYGEGYIRICFATSEENIINGIRLLGKAVNELMK
jgi:aspartate/methionine/tyrosine aminotransferase